jgi:hypothetical protein
MTDAKPTTKTLLVTFNPSNPDAGAGDFVVPVLEDGRVFFVGMRSKKPSELGRMVYVGKDVTVNDLFAKLVDSGRKVPSVEQTLKMLTAYVVMLQEHKVGNILSVEANAASVGFGLTKVANTPAGATKLTE